uniref:Uncharacterized protein n=1 Tax=Plectus sambesii TaxID=2011161 RepID=A0A914XL81_9BILA
MGETAEVMQELAERWQDLTSYVTEEVRKRWWERIVKAYSEPHRKYHTLYHIYQMFQHYDQNKDSLTDRYACAYAIFFHDSQLNGDAEAGSLQSRSTNVLWKRKEQLMRWDDSETNKISAEKRVDKERKVKFQDSDIFLSACTSGDEEEVTDLLAKGADVNTATVDGLTALHQASLLVVSRLDWPLVSAFDWPRGYALRRTCC